MSKITNIGAWKSRCIYKFEGHGDIDIGGSEPAMSYSVRFRVDDTSWDSIEYEGFYVNKKMKRRDAAIEYAKKLGWIL